MDECYFSACLPESESNEYFFEVANGSTDGTLIFINSEALTFFVAGLAVDEVIALLIDVGGCGVQADFTVVILCICLDNHAFDASHHYSTFRAFHRVAHVQLRQHTARHAIRAIQVDALLWGCQGG